MKTSGLVSLRSRREMHAVLLFALLIVATLSSISSVVAIGQYKLASHTMCKNATSSGCKIETHSFDAKDQYAYVYFRIEMGETGRFGGPTASWYYQSDSMEYSYTFDAYDVKKGETWWFYTWMPIRNDKADLRGFWRVDVIGPAGELLFTEQFTIGPFYQIRIDAMGVPESVSIPIKVDGEDYGQIKGGISKKLGFAPGTSHKLTVEKTTASAEGVRWYAQEDTWEFSGEGTQSFTFEEQYQLSIEIDPAGAVTVNGTGGYSKGAAVDIQIPEVVNVDSGRKLVRKSISVDKQEVATPPTSITMDKPHTIRIQYQKQYYLKVMSDYGNPQGEGWYDNGTKATFSVASPSPQAGVLGLLGGRMVFKAWTADSSSTSVSASIWMNGPKTVTAKWTTDNTLLYVVIGAIAAVVLIVALLLVRRRKKAIPSPAHGPVSVPAVAVHRFGGSGLFRRHFTIALLVLIVSTISLLGCQQAYAIPSSNMLEVPYHYQENDYYCGVASVQMAIQYISGDVIPQDTLAKELKTEPKKGTWTYMMPKAFDLRRYPAVLEAHATMDELKNQNSRGYVSIIVIWADTDHKYTHYVVVIGYNVTGIFVNDPWPSNWGQPVSRRTGEKAFISNKLLSNLWPYLDEWVLEIPYKSRVYAFTLSVTGVGDTYQSEPVTVVIDGAESGQIKRGETQSFYFKVETRHTISVDEYVSGPEGTRYYAADNTIMITKQDACVIVYVEQHRLLIETIAGTSEKWLAPDQTETLGPYDEIVPVDSGTRYFFVGLVVDGVEQETTSVTLHMDQPHAIAVRYVTQCFLKVISNFGDPKGEDWYAPGDVATYSVTTPYGFLIQHAFVSWTGDISSAESQGTLTMTRPYMIEAKWRDDYTQLFIVFVVATAAVIVPVFITKRRKPRQLTLPSTDLLVQHEAWSV